ncbi:hypothetical protein Goari_015203 [Gossypium aridum]|uniref:Uncharacterized protein n=1 Tax=Gossypium aridum TaxID=34290 RepID=A0A7J8XLU0_GOSAI|nr:hypothetical protein [Gossypium aridum]
MRQVAWNICMRRFNLRLCTEISDLAMSFFLKTSKQRLQILTSQPRLPTWLFVFILFVF